MKIGGYGSDELKYFYRVLEAAISEARAKSLDLPVHEMTRRLFAAAVSRRTKRATSESFYFRGCE